MLDLTNDEAQAAYDCIRGTMTVGYAKADLMSEAGENIAIEYIDWARFNVAPYQSATHGNRFVNNFANPAAGEEYGNFEVGGPMPVGSVLAKESYMVSGKGIVSPGPLFVMEKMPEGFHEESGDWRYSMVMPNGKVGGVTNGTGSEKVEFCIQCHVVAERDSMFFMPEEFRK